LRRHFISCDAARDETNGKSLDCPDINIDSFADEPLKTFIVFRYIFAKTAGNFGLL